MLFTLHYGFQLMVVYGDGSIKKVPVSNSFDVVCIDDNTAAVTTGELSSAPGINIVNTCRRYTTTPYRTSASFDFSFVVDGQNLGLFIFISHQADATSFGLKSYRAK
jgi:hypothetical protein